MKHYFHWSYFIIMILTITSIIGCSDKNKTTTTQTLEDNKLLSAYIKAKNTNDSQLIHIFLEEFPKTFQEMSDVFGFKDDLGPGPLYENGQEIIQFFASIQPKNKESYYSKFIEICINGKWEADNISSAFGIHKRILDNTDSVCSILKDKNDQEIISIFRFMFDGPHPKNNFNDSINNRIQREVPNKYERIKKLATYAYESLILEKHEH